MSIRIVRFSLLFWEVPPMSCLQLHAALSKSFYLILSIHEYYGRDWEKNFVRIDLFKAVGVINQEELLGCMNLIILFTRWTVPLKTHIIISRAIRLLYLVVNRLVVTMEVDSLSSQAGERLMERKDSTGSSRLFR